jgi:hypothetical protein
MSGLRDYWMGTSPASPEEQERRRLEEERRAQERARSGSMSLRDYWLGNVPQEAAGTPALDTPVPEQVAGTDELGQVPPVMSPEMTLFDPEGEGYDFETAIASGGQADAEGHWGSLDPRTGMVLKGINHPTFHMTVEAERSLGNEIVKREDGRYYSVPSTPPPMQPGSPFDLGVPQDPFAPVPFQQMIQEPAYVDPTAGLTMEDMIARAQDREAKEARDQQAWATLGVGHTSVHGRPGCRTRGDRIPQEHDGAGDSGRT